MDDEYFMGEALKEARKAFELDEVPIGAVIVHNNEIIARGFNRRNTDKNPLMHAEIIAINEAAKVIGDWRIEDCTIYITVEPCPMCSVMWCTAPLTLKPDAAALLLTFCRWKSLITGAL